MSGKSSALTWLFRGAIGVLVAFVLLLLLLVGVGAWLHEPLPTAEPGPRAEALADRMLQAVDAEAWQRTGAVAWSFHTHEHLWDTRRNLVRVKDGELTVWLDLGSRTGVAHRGGEPVDEAERGELVDWAYGAWANDSFWLNPVVKVRDPGTSRGVVEVDGDQALLVTYSSGGVTPGDSYLWHLGPDGRPERWEMWVGILPIGGMDVTWEDWTELPTGAWVSTRHEWGVMTVDLGDVRAAETLEGLGEAGAFKVLDPI